MTDARAPKVVILNDTSSRSHHGCSRVMRLLRGGLEQQGLVVTATHPAHADWSKDAGFVRHLRDADLVVINGEGTLHHGRDAGKTLLQVVDYARANDCPVALINALYQDNPPEWTQWVAGCSLLSARDNRSADEMRAAGGSNVRMVPDLSLSAGAVDSQLDRSGIIVGDSVRLEHRRHLARFAARSRASFVPIKTLPHRVFQWPLIGSAAQWVLFNLYNGVAIIRQPEFTLPQTEVAYLAQLGSASLHVTGRFHSVCLSLVTGTPFLAVASNSWKIEALLEDAGLGRNRIVDPNDLGSLADADMDQPFSDAETNEIAGFLTRAQTDATALFADLAKLARNTADSRS